MVNLGCSDHSALGSLPSSEASTLISLQDVAVKQLPLAGATAAEIRLVLQEVVALAHASESCKYACRLLGMCRKDEQFCIVMKKYDGSLHNRLNALAGEEYNDCNEYQ